MRGLKTKKNPAKSLSWPHCHREKAFRNINFWCWNLISNTGLWTGKYQKWDHLKTSLLWIWHVGLLCIFCSHPCGCDAFSGSSLALRAAERSKDNCWTDNRSASFWRQLQLSHPDHSRPKSERRAPNSGFSTECQCAFVSVDAFRSPGCCK